MKKIFIIHKTVNLSDLRGMKAIADFLKKELKKLS